MNLFLSKEIIFFIHQATLNWVAKFVLLKVHRNYYKNEKIVNI